MSKKLDLTGQIFGKITVINFNEEKSKEKRRTYWNCICECGNKCIIQTQDLRSGHTKSCGKCNYKQIKIGDKFGEWEIIKFDEKTSKEKRRKYWICRCKCGTIKSVCESSLKRDKNESKMCKSCSSKEVQSREEIKKTKSEFMIKRQESERENLTNMRFGKLIVTSFAYTKNGRGYWNCECDCGNNCIVSTCHLKDGHTNSCGCYAKEQSSKAWKKMWENDEFKKNHTGENNHNWIGGITPISKYLRNSISDWFENCKKQANYTCQLTNKKNIKLHTHHLYSFNLIVKDAHDKYNIEIKEHISEYNDDELNLLKEYIKECHKDNSNAIILSDDMHRLFHSLYGKGNNTPEQYYEFDKRYKNGEFDNYGLD